MLQKDLIYPKNKSFKGNITTWRSYSRQVRNQSNNVNFHYIFGKFLD